MRSFLRPGIVTLLLAVAVIAPGADNPPTYVFRHLAGAPGGPGFKDGVGTAARFNDARGVVCDAAGNIYVTDTGNNTIRKIAPDGTVTTMAGTAPLRDDVDATGAAARLAAPAGPSLDAAGNLIFGSGFVVKSMTAAGAVTTLAGNKNESIGSYSPIDGTGTNALFFQPRNTAIDRTGIIYVADPASDQLRKISPGAVVTNLSLNYPSGWTGSPFGADPTVNPYGAADIHCYQIATDATGNLYFPHFEYDSSNGATPFSYVIAKADSAGTVTVLTQLPAMTAFTGMAFDTAGRLYVGTQNGIVMMDQAGTVSTIPNTAGISGCGLAINATGDIIVSAFDEILKVTTSGTISVVAGQSAAAGSVDATGDAARFQSPIGIVVDSAGNAFVADAGNETIRRVTPAGVVTTIAGKPGQVGSADGTGGAASFHLEGGFMAIDGSGNLYVTEPATSHIRRITPDGTVTMLGNLGADPLYIGLGIDSAGNLYYTTLGTFISLIKRAPDGTLTTLSNAIDELNGLTVDSAGDVFVTDHKVINKLSADGKWLGVAGGGLWGGQDGPPGTDTGHLQDPSAITVDSAGNLYFLDQGENTVRMWMTNGNLVTLGGTGNYTAYAGSADGTGQAAQFNDSMGITVDKSGKIYIADTGNHAIRIGEVLGPPVITTQPAAETVAAGASAQFSVVASSAAPLTYQWILNGSAIAGATSDKYSLSSVAASNAGDYSVVVTNQMGSATSQAAKLTVSAASSGSTGSSGSSGGGGGGAMSGEFVLALVLLGLSRILLPRENRNTAR
ncbi:MAG TPA: immunoglobulin domain-containing protein [Candidatus Didemnitutus sp.]|nr:immunoglobulin domain-containing protein [Candidatus Didemnitutus sp.]